MELTNPTDYTLNGVCSQCGSCCGSLLPVTDKELSDMKAYADANGIHPELPDLDRTMVYMQCPFLDTERNLCRIYPARPAVCRSFSCHSDTRGNAVSYQALTGITKEADVPLVQNVWRIYNQTGVKLDGKLVTWDEAPVVRATGSDGTELRIQVGEAVTVGTKSGRTYVGSLCVGLYPEAMFLFDGDEHKICRVPFDDIAEIN